MTGSGERPGVGTRTRRLGPRAGDTFRRAAAVLAAACVALLAAGPARTPAQTPPAAADTGEASCGASGQDAAPDARSVLRRARERYRSLRSLRAAFRETVRVPLLGRERSGRGTWYQKGSGLFKLDYTEPPEDVILSDGNHVWTYYPSSQPGQVTRTALDRSARGREMVDLMGRIFREARSGYRPRLAGRETVAGVETRHVVLTPTAEAPYREVELWIGAGDHLVRKFHVVEENRTERTVTLTDLEPNASIADSVFRFEVPEGAEVFSG